VTKALKLLKWMKRTPDGLLGDNHAWGIVLSLVSLLLGQRYIFPFGRDPLLPWLLAPFSKCR
jgi:hypothetical protein